MGLRINSLSELGNGAWKLNGNMLPAQNMPAKPKAKSNKRWTGMSPPQLKLLSLVNMAWPNMAVSEYKKAIPGRRFTLDVVFEQQKIACEVDGWQFHGQHKDGFHRDREKDKLLLLNGWRVLRFTAKEINADGIGCLRTIERLLGLKSAIPLS